MATKHTKSNFSPLHKKGRKGNGRVRRCNSNGKPKDDVDGGAGGGGGGTNGEVPEAEVFGRFGLVHGSAVEPNGLSAQMPTMPPLLLPSLMLLL